jgi:hypothetical protein
MRPADMSAVKQKPSHWLFAWTHGRGGGGGETVEEDTPRQPVPLDAIRCQMVRSVRGCSDPHRARAADKVMAATSALDLWMVRCDLYQFLSHDLGEMEANRRMETLRASFQGHVALAATPPHAPSCDAGPRRVH